MSKIDVNIHKVNDLIPSFSKVTTKISNTTDDIASICSQLDYRVKSRHGIDRRLHQITAELESMERKMQKLVSFLHYSMDEYSNAEKQITKQVFQTLKTCSRVDTENAAVLQQKNTKKHGLWDVVEGINSGGYKAGKEFVEGIVDIVTDPIETIENTFNAIMHPIETYNYISKAISDSYERDVINGDANSRAEWFSYAITTLGLSVIGTKGLGSVSKTGMASTKVAINSGVSKVKEASEKVSNLNLLPYAPRNQLAYAAVDAIPYNVINGNKFKDRLLSMVKMESKGIGNGYQYWNKTTQFKNVKVYQRDDIINPNKKDARGRTNLERMQKGLAPLGPDGKSINLHHMTQRNESSIAEVTQTFHKDNSSVIHINPNTIPSGINRSEFNKWRTDYWKNRANDF